MGRHFISECPSSACSQVVVMGLPHLRHEALSRQMAAVNPTPAREPAVS
jgi:hypothetical protein